MSNPQNGTESVLTLNEFANASYEDWRKEAEATLDGAPFEKKLVTKTPEGIDVQPIYTKDDLVSLETLGTQPGQPPYLRGIANSNSWEVAQAISGESAEAFNKALLSDLGRGQNAVVLEASCKAEYGVPVQNVDDLGRALKGVELDAVPLFVECGSKGLPYLSLLVAQLRRDGKNLSSLRGCLNQDPVGTLAENGELPNSLEHSYAQLALTTEWATKNLPKFGTIGVSTVAYHNAGATAVQELAYALATGVEYLRALESRGLNVTQVASRTRFTFAIGADVFMAVAKFRAARLLWSKIVAASGGSADAQKMQIHATTSLYNKSKLDPYVNMLRTTTEAFAAVAGGCQSLNVGAFDEVIRPADEFSRRIARNTQLILSEECHFDHVVDPAGGSYYVEVLTDELAKKAWALFQEIEKIGGMSKALEAGIPQKNVKAAADKKWEAIALRRNSLIGVNVYANPTEKPLTVPAKAEAAAAACSNGELPASVAPISQKIAEAPEEVIDACIEAATQGATVCQIRKALAAGDSAPTKVTALESKRAAEPFEELRAACEAAGRPKVFLANMGPLRQFKARADFSQGFFTAGGFDIVYNKGFQTPEAAAEAAAQSGAPIVVICSTDDTYPEIVPALTKQLKAAAPKTSVVLAGYPKDLVESFKEAGVDEFIHVRANCYEILNNLLAKATAKN